MDLSVLDQFFAFQVGDWVRPKGRRDLSPMLVVDRCLEQRCGGVQAHYGTRAFASDGNYLREKVGWTEVELEASESFEEFAVKSATRAGLWAEFEAFVESRKKQEAPQE